MLILPCTLSGRFEYKGLIRQEPDGLAIEINKWSWQVLGSEVREVRIASADVGRVEFKTGMTGARIDIQLLTIKGFESFVFNSERSAGLIRIKFARKDRNEAARLSSNFSLLVSEALIRRSVDPDDGYDATVL